jgi:hypothetical protein
LVDLILRRVALHRIDGAWDYHFIMPRREDDELASDARTGVATAFELYAAGEAMMRATLERRYPKAPRSVIERKLAEWLRSRPAAPHGDSEGRPVPWPRKRA